MDVNIAVLADFASVTREGKLNIMGIFGAVNPPSPFPFQLPQMYLVLSFYVPPAELGSKRNLKVVLCDEDGKQVFAGENELNVPNPKNNRNDGVTVNQLIGMNNFTFHKAGSYQFSILVDGDTKTNVPLRVSAPRTPDSEPAKEEKK